LSLQAFVSSLDARLSMTDIFQMAQTADLLGVSASFVVVCALLKMASESCGYNYRIQTTSFTNFL
jgi:hypothetical protein